MSSAWRSTSYSIACLMKRKELMFLISARVPYSGYPNTPDPVIRGDTVWAITLDEQGAAAVERFRVAWK